MRGQVEVNMSDAAYQDVLDLAHRLDPAEQLRLLQELQTALEEQSEAGPKRSIMELEGLGSEIWKGIDAHEYVDKERGGWANDR